jgi:hypothetical protein
MITGSKPLPQRQICPPQHVKKKAAKHPKAEIRTPTGPPRSRTLAQDLPHRPRCGSQQSQPREAPVPAQKSCHPRTKQSSGHPFPAVSIDGKRQPAIPTTNAAAHRPGIDVSSEPRQSPDSDASSLSSSPLCLRGGFPLAASSSPPSDSTLNARIEQLEIHGQPHPGQIVGLAWDADVYFHDDEQRIAWYRAPSRRSSDGSRHRIQIGGRTLQLRAEDIGHTIVAEWTPVLNGVQGEPLTASVVVQPQPLCLTILGEPRRGCEVRAAVSPGGTPGRIRWYRGATPVVLNHSAYTISQLDEGQTITAEFLPDGGEGHSLRTTIGPIQPLIPEVSDVEIHGDPQVFAVLSLRYAFRNGIEGRSLIQWYRTDPHGVPTLIATNVHSITVSPDDLDARLHVRIVPVDDAGTHGPPVVATADGTVRRPPGRILGRRPPTAPNTATLGHQPPAAPQSAIDMARAYSSY